LRSAVVGDGVVERKWMWLEPLYQILVVDDFVEEGEAVWK
jgi:hypothetical protein